MRIRSGIVSRRMTARQLSQRRNGLSSSKRSPLLSASRQGTSLDNTRMGIMNASSVQSARLLRSNYEKLEKSAASLEEQTKLLAEKTEAGAQDLAGTAAALVGHFNDTLDYLDKSSGILNNYYHQTMKEIVATNQSLLEEAGISVRKDGTLALDKEKLAGADAEAVKKALGVSGDFAKRMQAVASRVSDNAGANALSASNQYTSTGGLANSYLSRYNFLG